MDASVTAGAEKGKRETPGAQLSISRLALAFLKIGCIGFGGGMATIALMEQELVRRRRLLYPEEFLHGVGPEQVLGPFAVNTSARIGYRLYGLARALICGSGANPSTSPDSAQASRR